MITARHIQRLWDERRYDKLVGELLFARIESTPCVKSHLTGSTAAAAIALIRMDELGQTSHPLAQVLVRAILSSQGNDGGWNDPMLCALCVRALLTSDGHGVAIERGIQFLANLQKTEGIWPREPLRRMPSDSLASAFILLQLANVPSFREAIRFTDALACFDLNGKNVDPDVAKLAHHAILRSRVARSELSSWS